MISVITIVFKYDIWSYVHSAYFAVVPRASSSTAFTVSFDNEEGSPKANLSLQDAAKKSGTTRYILN